MQNTAITLAFISVGIIFVSFVFMKNKNYVHDKNDGFKAERLGKDLDKQLTKVGYKVYVFGIALFVLSCVIIAISAIF